MVNGRKTLPDSDKTGPVLSHQDCDARGLSNRQVGSSSSFCATCGGRSDSGMDSAKSSSSVDMLESSFMARRLYNARRDNVSGRICSSSSLSSELTEVIDELPRRSLRC